MDEIEQNAAVVGAGGILSIEDATFSLRSPTEKDLFTWWSFVAREVRNSWRPFDKLLDQLKSLPADIRKEILIAHKDLALSTPSEAYFSEQIESNPAILQMLIWQLSEPKPQSLKEIKVDKDNVMAVWLDVDEIIHLKKLMQRMGDKESFLPKKNTTS